MIRQATQRSWDILAGVLLAAGYINVGSVSIEPASFGFSLRGPVFWRLTSGLPPYLHGNGVGVGSDSYPKIEFLLATLLFLGKAHIRSGTVVASAIILRVDSPLFRWNRTDRILRTSGPFQTIIRSLLNFAIGMQIAIDRLAFVVTGVRYSPEHRLEFTTTARIMQRQPRRLPSKFTIPQMTPSFRHLNRILGTLLLLQLLTINGIAMGRGGELAFFFTGDMFRLRRPFGHAAQSTASDDGD